MNTSRFIIGATSDWATIGVAIWGAITGTAALALNAAKELRDRPDLRVGFSYGVDLDGGWWQVSVTNHGRRAVTVVEAGVVIALDFKMVNTDESGNVNEGKFQPKVWTSEEVPYLLQPGDMRRHRCELAEWPSLFATADMPLRAFAIDSRGKRTVTAPTYALSDLLSAGWHPEDEIPDDYGVGGEPIQPKALAPAWKIWRPRLDRRGKQGVSPELHIGPAGAHKQGREPGP